MRRWLILAVAAMAAVTVIGPPPGLALTVTTCALLAAGVRRRDAWSIVYLVLAAALAGVATVRAADWLVGWCVVAAVLLAALASAGGASWRQVVVGLVPRPALVVLRAPVAVTPSAGWRHPLTAAAIAAVLLAVFVPLFASADAAFAHLLGELVPDDAVDDPVARLAVWLAFVLVGGALLTARTAMPAAPGTPRLTQLEWAVPLAVLVALVAAFVALQLTTLYGGHDHVLRTAGLTYAEYAREGFAQLLAAAALTLAVIAAAVRWTAPSRLRTVLLVALCVLTLAVLASALTRLDLYMDAYGFTRLRLSAQATILWLGGVFTLILVARGAAWLPRATVALTAATLLAFAVSNPDLRIAERNLDRYERTGRLDERTLEGLSADAAPALVDHRALTECPLPDGVAGFNLGRSRAREALGCPG
ncbi:MAG TPA: DUF4173 domain-containing protein [Solirubrobacteraceae bacterium]|nr:DUF4173 domain-containing protein [Solirubrobacteraceae bacterium]